MTFAKRWRWYLLGGGAVAVVVAQLLLRGTTYYPESGGHGCVTGKGTPCVTDSVNQLASWILRNRDTFLRDIGGFVQDRYEGLRDVLLNLPWFFLPLLVLVVILRSGRWLTATFVAAGLAYVELAGLHREGMETIALMTFCIVTCILIGVPLGILTGLNPRLERAVRPVLDAMQSLPITFYLVPMIYLFGIKQVPAAIATAVFGLAPMIRITALGIREVPPASVEAGLIFGSTRWQLLWKVQMPQAIKSLFTAVNQTIMLCLGMVVLAGLIGAGGLGAEQIDTLKLRSPGKAFLVGLAIFAVAMAFDRTTRSLVDRRRVLPVPTKQYWTGAAALLVGAWAIGRFADAKKVPWTFDHSIVQPIDDFVVWIRDTSGDQLQWVNDFVVRDVVIRLRDLLGVSLAWPVLIALVVALSWKLRGWKFATFSLAGLLAIGWVGMWAPALETLSQLVVAVVIALMISVPVGIFVGRRPRAESALEPLLDALQTFPSLIYAIPFVIVFAVGYVPGILATVLYAIPPGIRLTALAIKQVPQETLEAATTFGATPRQRLWGVHVPLAMRGIMLAVNQVVMMAMSMVIITGMFGGQGLGFKCVEALTRPNAGIGVACGIALYVMTIILDRLTESAANFFQGDTLSETALASASRLSLKAHL